MGNILIKDCVVIPMENSGRDYFYGSVGIEGDRIALVAENSDDAALFERKHKGDIEIIDGRGKLIMPGLINTHCHVPMTLMRGYADDIPLMEWLNERVWPFEQKLTRDDIKLGARLGISEMLLGGTTTFVDMYWMEEAISEEVISSGIRAVLSATFVDSNFDTFLSDLEKVVAISRSPESEGRIGVMAAPHAPYSCSPEHITATLALCDKYGIGILTHVSETKDEIDIIADRTGKTPVEFLDSLGFFDRMALAVHGVYLTDNDIDILRSKGVSLAHNPESNMKLASGVAPIAKAVKKGLNVSLGTDGTCSNNDLDMWGEMRSASFLQKVATSDPCALSAREVLRMATVGGAKAIGRDKDLGRICEGMLADIIVVDINKPHHYPRHDIIANLVYCGKSSDVDSVIVNGRMLVRGGVLIDTDLGDLYEKVDLRVKELTSR